MLKNENERSLSQLLLYFSNLALKLVTEYEISVEKVLELLWKMKFPLKIRSICCGK